MRQFCVIICLVLVLCVAVSGQHTRRNGQHARPNGQPRLQHNPLSGQHPRRRAQPRGPGGPPPKPHSQPTPRCTNTRPEKMSAKFYFYDKNHLLIPSVISKDKIKSGAFNNTNLKRTYKFLIHGYNSQEWKEWTWLMKEEYLEKGDYIVIVVDWSDYRCTDPVYPYKDVAKDVKEVAESICDFLWFLINDRAIDRDNYHLIGYGVGAHVAGRAGNCTCIKNYSRHIGRVTGLDPSSEYASSLTDLTLNRNDALVVDIIHTNGDFYGDPKTSGDNDFYPNGGMRQPGCTTAECSHSRAIDYFIESINSREFVATQCDYETIKAGNTCASGKYAIMGDNFARTKYNGAYYIKTNSHPPFARGLTKA